MTNSNSSNVPVHLGLILDGNRRWAKNQGLSSLEGHKAGYENLKTVCKAAFKSGVKYVSAYVFSTENWNRSEEEVGYLMRLLLWVAKNEIKELNDENIRVRFVGSRERLSPQVIKAIESTEEETSSNTGGTLALCLNYGGQLEIVDAVKKIITSGTAAADITPELLGQNLYAPDVPPVDLLIRTSGEQRLSNFMLWRVAYSELLFVAKHWPDFSEADLDAALADFANRQRRFGQ